MWDDLFEKVQTIDIKWMEANATKYIYDQDEFAVDYVYIENSKMTYTASYGDIEWLVNENFYKDMKSSRKPKSGYFEHNGQVVYLTGYPITKTNQTGHAGWLVLGRNITPYLTDNISSVLGSNRIASIQFNTLAITQNIQHIQGYLYLNHTFELEDNHEPIIVTIAMSFKKITQIIANYRLSIVFVIFITSIIGLSVLFYFINKFDHMFKSTIDSITHIANGQYLNQLKSGDIYEINELSVSVNMLTENIRLQQQKIEKSYFEGIQTLVKTLEMVDSYTKGHSERVSFYAVEIAKNLGWDQDEVETIRIAALMHDIGKIGVPSDILNKTGKLTFDELEIIKQHPIIGFEILDISDMFSNVKEIIKYHHERYDGNGYPMNLHGLDIPIGARLLCVVDSFDAMTTNRSYRSAMTVENSVSIIQSEIGRQFDPLFAVELIKHAQNLYNDANRIFRHASVEEIE